MLMNDDTAGHEISEKDRRAAAIFWWILIATRFVIPLYVIYAIYLYWTMPPDAYLKDGY